MMIVFKNVHPDGAIYDLKKNLEADGETRFAEMIEKEIYDKMRKHG